MRAKALLGPADRARADRRRTRQARRRTRIGRALLRIVSGRQLGLAPELVVTGTSPHGAPLAGTVGTGAGGIACLLAVSIAHTRGLVVAAASGAALRVGVDVERLDRSTRPLAIARRHFEPGEAQALAELPEAARRPAFLRAWTLKEAWGKAAGVAIPSALPRVAFPMVPLAAAGSGATRHHPRRLLSGPLPLSGSGPRRRWAFWTLGAGVHTIGVAVCGRDPGRLVPIQDAW